MNGHVMPHRHIVANLDGRLLVQRVQHATILNVYTIADAYAINVTTQNGVKPNTAIVTNHHIANDSSIVSQITIFAYLWSKASDRFH
jgi:hypothetical protein